MERLDAEQRLKKLLIMVGEQGASDLHLVVGRHPTLRISGKLHPLAEEGVLTPADTKAFSEVVLTDDKKAELDADGHTDLSYSLEERARFRVNVFLQKDPQYADDVLILSRNEFH